MTSTGNRGNAWNTFEPGASRNVAVGVNHGTRFAYEERGCRCSECTTARTTADRIYRKKTTPPLEAS